MTELNLRARILINGKHYLTQIISPTFVPPIATLAVHTRYPVCNSQSTYHNIMFPSRIFQVFVARRVDGGPLSHKQVEERRRDAERVCAQSVGRQKRGWPSCNL